MPASLSTVTVRTWRSLASCLIFIAALSSLKPLLFRGGVGVGSIVLGRRRARWRNPTPGPSPEGEGSFSSNQRFGFVVDRSCHGVAGQDHVGMRRARWDHR